jgi:hypothetical protein
LNQWKTDKYLWATMADVWEHGRYLIDMVQELNTFQSS